jgi:hypothetical protein
LTSGAVNRGMLMPTALKRFSEYSSAEHNFVLVSL